MIVYKPDRRHLAVLRVAQNISKFLGFVMQAKTGSKTFHISRSAVCMYVYIYIYIYIYIYKMSV